MDDTNDSNKEDIKVEFTLNTEKTPLSTDIVLLNVGGYEYTTHINIGEWQFKLTVRNDKKYSLLSLHLFLLRNDKNIPCFVYIFSIENEVGNDSDKL